MKTKYIKVKTIERLPKDQQMYIVIFKNNKVGKFNFWNEDVFKEAWIELVEYWFEEVEDKSDEMLEMLNEFVYAFCGEQECEQELSNGLGNDLFICVIKAKKLIKEAAKL